MNYKTVGRSGLRVSPVCLGGMTFGDDWGWGADETESEKIIKRFMEIGGNFIDTANVYTNNHSEKIIGNVVGRHSSTRAGMVLATKFGMNVFPYNPNGGGNGTKAIMENVHHSLRRLQTDYVDLLWIHAWDWNTPMEETLRTMNDLVSAGKVSIDNVLAYFEEPGKINLAEFMERNFMFNMTMEKFGYLTCRTLTTFKRDFKKAFSTTPRKWLTQKRLELAHYQLSEKQRKPIDVYFEVGFENLSHFSYAFKKRFGYPPNALVEKIAVSQNKMTML